VKEDVPPIPKNLIKKAKASKKLLKMAFEYDKKHGAHKWEKCALNGSWNKNRQRWEDVKYSGLKAVSNG